jgi:hypothetical protein
MDSSIQDGRLFRSMGAMFVHKDSPTDLEVEVYIAREGRNLPGPPVEAGTPP